MTTAADHDREASRLAERAAAVAREDTSISTTTQLLVDLARAVRELARGWGRVMEADELPAPERPGR